VWQRSNVSQTRSIDMSQMKGRTKGNATRRKHHGLEKALRNRERSDGSHSNDTLDGHTDSISSRDATGESEGRERI